MRFFQTASLLLSSVPLGLTAVVPEQHLDKRQSSVFVTSGPAVETINQAVPVRLEIRALQQNADLWNLYLLGLARMQATPQSQRESFYQMAGIHGRPYVAWDGVTAASGQSNTGYCPHSSTLFATWHRPYLAAYEQILYGFVKQVASEFPTGATRDKYVAAATSFRIPYWDWAINPPAGQSSLPASLQAQTVSVTTPSGQQTIANPLFSYRFNPLSTSDFPTSPINRWPQTLRYPTSNTASATSQNSQVGARLDNGRSSVKSRLYNLIASASAFNTYTTKAGQQGDSLEGIHDTIHGTVGSNGHMSYIDYSAFDPIFFLHHTMIDRMFALWQVVYPTSYIGSSTTQSGTYTVRAGQTVDGNTALTPFRKDSSNFHTSNGIRNVTTLGYSYPELSNGSTRASVINAINAQYGNTGSTTRRRTQRDLQERQIFGTKNNVDHKEYVANFDIPRASLTQSIFVYFFNGPPASTDAAQWPLADNLVGSHTFFIKPSADMADGAARIGGAMPLTESLKKRNQLANNIDLAVLANVKQNLHARFATMDDQPIAASTLTGLSFKLSSTLVTEIFDSSVISGLIGGIWTMLTGLPIDLPKWGAAAEYTFTPRYS